MAPIGVSGWNPHIHIQIHAHNRTNHIYNLSVNDAACRQYLHIQLRFSFHHHNRYHPKCILFYRFIFLNFKINFFTQRRYLLRMNERHQFKYFFKIHFRFHMIFDVLTMSKYKNKFILVLLGNNNEKMNHLLSQKRTLYKCNWRLIVVSFSVLFFGISTKVEFDIWK